ncbi:Uncharacterised protein [uncultured archaeon]|nr:Uncharacterised protein [uncultured archaeon]
MHGEADITQIIEILQDLSIDRKVPRNVRSVIEDARKELMRTEENLATKINTTVSMLDEISNDPNIQSFTRTQIWNVVSMLEAVEAEETEMQQGYKM